MSRFWFIRHGPTHRDGLIGWTDAPADLSDLEALDRLNTYLPQDAVVVSSDLIRCVATADALATGRKRLPSDPDLRELHFGDWEDRTFKQVAQTHAELSRAYWSDPGPHAPPNGESWDAAAARVSRGVDRLRDAHPDTDIIVVAHFGAILTQVQRAAGMSAKAALSFKIDNLSVTRLEHMGTAWRVLGVNHTV
ncbi:histidine phosphatase family protein [Neptunicoccus cionae]|uniref:histidine phosphatase family protein n=1 Tax=Neptunicoccus cionae TaxID=2035344 RepID=UPI000C787F0C|nr:histidine phosphatase family protein [Amylibacter cionae]PLS23162.1 histidine phosphatase family protein [Amylibacter cionae]